MKDWRNFITISCLLMFSTGIYQNGHAQENLAQQAFAIFQQNCLNCHGEHGAFTEEIIIEHSALIDSGAVVPGKPGRSKFYKRLIENTPENPRMPLGQPPLPPAAVNTIRSWILAGAPDWADTFETDSSFITPKQMLETIEKHVNSLAPFDRAFARYFTLTHLYNAGETTEALHAYQRALSKLVNSLSWGREVIRPQTIDPEGTIFYIDLRDYEWEIGTNRWTLIEEVYPNKIEFNAPTQTNLHEKLTILREEMNCEVPFVHVDWFIATASLPPLYHDILDLPQTDRELEARLEVNVVENIRNAAGKRVWRAGFNNSGVSNHNRVVERHLSRYGAYWKSYDFAGSVRTQNIFTHPLSFTHDGGEIIFNLPNGLQAYYLADADGNRLDTAPISIVSNPAASDPTVRNGLSCIGCHTEGMKTFEDQVRAVVQQNTNPPYNKAQALRLYTEKAVMDELVSEDTQRYRQALEAAGDIFGGIEPVQRFHEAFQAPLDAPHAASAIGLETEVFLQKIRENVSLQNLGLLVLETGTVKRDTWTEQFSEIIFALDFPKRSTTIRVEPQEERIPGTSVHIPDINLRAAIAEALGKNPNASVTYAEMETLTTLEAPRSDIKDLTGIQHATHLEVLKINGNPISDLSPLAGLRTLKELNISWTKLSDLSSLTELINLQHLEAWSADNSISDLSPLVNLTSLRHLDMSGSRGITDISPLARLTNLTYLRLYDNAITDISPLTGLIHLEMLYVEANHTVLNLAPLAHLKRLRFLHLARNKISDISALSGLIALKTLYLHYNQIVDVSPLASLQNLKRLLLHHNNISDFSSLDRIRKNLEKFTGFGNPGFPEGGRKIEGPWLWLMLPIKMDGTGLVIDYLAEASDGKVTEQQIATLGATEGHVIGNSVWSSGSLAPYNQKVPGSNTNNLKKILRPQENASAFVVYGAITLHSPSIQRTRMFVGATRGRKVWLNGELVYEDYIHIKDGYYYDYQDFSAVTLKKGKNVLLVGCEYNTKDPWGFFFGFAPGTEYMVENPSVGYTFSESNIHAGDTFTLDLSARNIIDLAGWQFDISFDPAALKAVEINEGDFLKTSDSTTFFQKGTLDNTTGKITGLSSASLSGDGVSGTGVLLSVTFSAKTDGRTQLALHNFQLGDVTGAPISAGPHEVEIVIEGQLATGDVNRDGQVSILDMILVARHLGETAPTNSEVDVNRDGVISILDLIIVAQHLGESTDAAAASIFAIDGIEGLDPTMIQAWIERAQIEDDGSIAFREGIAYLQSLLALLVPEETVLLPNYPNPFNPETWIPYQLSEPAEVTLRIYAVNGELVRTLVLGHKPAGIYQSRSRAAYWDGKNEVGEAVASGIYFYTLTAGDFTATRKLLIWK